MNLTELYNNLYTRSIGEAPQKFAEQLENYRDVDFGSFKPKEIELVYNDWYQKRHIVKTLHKISLQ
ncbi:hypothetical protein [Sphingobacterium sp. FBM7-1]|uniref:hypothetical protein n=1 Tax=Sphingobacterium sp. FBM7-1 TaxID=2886688 RepID=UPI001D100DC4|nr:hypothetical protein [Sphingobacterium sp. FBM7-1]MCC2598223.1 hypothetical protein [Sphingobacterium sp. FBM7-1]